MPRKPSIYWHEQCSPCAWPIYHTGHATDYTGPPYADTTGYDGVGGFDSDTFWETMRTWGQRNTVVISEYTAPPDFGCVLEMATRTDLGDRAGEKIPRIERLFRLI